MSNCAADLISDAAAELIFALDDCGFRFRRAGDRLFVSPAEQLTPEITAAIKEHRQDVLAFLRSRGY